ncbi:hypothetical protein QUF72_01255 [Desulfobacterales bacterium HSG2]|nr:hypothetical protein [Desulfobacterales bacterium HSG2]
MLYKEFRNAAKRHLNTCKFMLHNLETLKKNKPSERDVLINVYYLGGYVTECIVKYAIYSSLGYRTHRDIKELNKHEHGMSYEDDMKHHNFRSLVQEHLFRIKGRDVFEDASILKDQKGDITKLYQEWGPEIRYTYKGKVVNKKRITEFIEKVEEAHTIIKRAVGG